MAVSSGPFSTGAEDRPWYVFFEISAAPDGYDHSAANSIVGDTLCMRVVSAVAVTKR